MQIVPRRRDGDYWLRSFRDEIDRLFEDFFRAPTLFGRTWGEERPFLPPVDVRETDSDILVEAELPGVDPKQVEVSLEGNTLRLRGERKHEHEEKTKNVHRVERYFGEFERHIPLPEGINPDDVEASYKDGVLTIRIGKREEVKPKSIEVKVAK